MHVYVYSHTDISSVLVLFKCTKVLRSCAHLHVHHNEHVTEDGEEEQQPVTRNDHRAEAALAISKIHTSLCLSKCIK